LVDEQSHKGTLSATDFAAQTMLIDHERAAAAAAAAAVRSVHITHLTSRHLTSPQLTQFRPNRVRFTVHDPSVRRGGDQSRRTHL